MTTSVISPSQLLIQYKYEMTGIAHKKLTALMNIQFVKNKISLIIVP